MNDVPRYNQTRQQDKGPASFQETGACAAEGTCKKHPNPKVGKSFSHSTLQSNLLCDWILICELLQDLQNEAVFFEARN